MREAEKERGIVLVPMTNWVPLGARLSRVPETVTAEPPGVSVWEPIMYAPAALAV